MRTGWIGVGLGVAMAWVACGGEAADSEVKSPAPLGESAVDVPRARKLMYQGEEALKAEEFAKARDFLRQADRYANDTVRDEMRVVAERIDREEATVLVADAVQAAKEGKCAEGLDAAAELTQLPDKGVAFDGFVRKFSAEANANCLLGMLEQGESLRAIRMLAETDDAKRALGPKAYQEVEAALTEAVTERLEQAVGELLEQKKWTEVVAKLEEVVRSGEASQVHVKPVLDQVVAGVTAEVTTVIDDGLDQPLGAAAALKRADELMAIAWQGGGGEDAQRALKLPKVPAALQKRRDSLEFGVVCASVRCRESEPKAMWIYGKVPLKPTMDPQGEGQKTLAHGTKVWQIATGAGVALVAEKDPGKLEGLADRIGPASGWVSAAGLKASDTTAMMPPGDALVGTRVWGPLRERQKAYELGTVVGVKRGQAEVRRMSDGQTTTVPVMRLHLGRVEKGMTVLALCGGGFDPSDARVDDVQETKFAAQGDPRVSVTCLDDDGKPTDEKRKELMGSIRIMPTQLPPRR